MVLVMILTSSAVVLGAGQFPGGPIEPGVGRYTPVDGGWRIRIAGAAPSVASST